MTQHPHTQPSPSGAETIGCDAPSLRSPGDAEPPIGNAVGAPLPFVSYDQPIRYGGYRIYRNDFTAHPDWRSVAWEYVHDDYDGPEDNRCGHAASVEACIVSIQEQDE